MRRLFVLSSGSWEASIVGRNALGRLLTAPADGVFQEVDYIFFPAGTRGSREPASGFRVHEIPGRPDVGDRPASWRSRWRGLRDGWAEIRSLAERRRPDVVGVVDPFISGLLGRELARRLGVPLSVTLVSNYRLSWEVARLNPIPFLPPAATFLVEGHVLSAAERIHVDCRHYGEYARERGAPGARIRRIPRYADPVFYDGEPDPGIWNRLDVPDPRPVVYVGRLSPEKYALDLAEAFRRIASGQPGRRLVVIGGGGPQEEDFFAVLREAGLSDRVLVRRGLERIEILSVLAAAGVVLATHAGYALLEAALAGAPVVAFDYEWHPELIRDGRTGRLVEYRNPGAMAEAALELLGEPARARTLGDRLRQHARSEYRLEDHLRALRESYLELLEGRRSRSGR